MIFVYIFAVIEFDLLQTATSLGFPGFWIWGFSEKVVLLWRAPTGRSGFALKSVNV